VAELTGERAYWLAWSRISGIGPVLLRRLQQYFGNLESAWQAGYGELQAVEGFGEQTVNGIIKERSQLNPEQFLAQHQQQNPFFWTPADSDYPRLLLEIPSPPPVLYYRGQLQPSEIQGLVPAVAIVGTRDPSDYGRRWTRKISTVLAKKGFLIVSGMAEGIDTEAHRACLEAGGRTIAVFGTGVDVVYPHRNQELYQQILTHGVAVSEYPDGTPPDRVHFPRRNRVIAGLSRAVLVMEAPHKSGALITAHIANDFFRDVYVLPGSLDNTRCLGCLGLLNRGANAILGERQLLEMLEGMPQLDLFPQTNPAEKLPNLSPQMKQVWQAIAYEPTSFDTIVEQTGLSAGLVSSSLLELELMGLISQQPGMRYQKT